MSLWAIIPVKPLKNAKSRLSGVLSTDERYDFAQAMFKHVLSVVISVPQITGTLVISRDTKALSIARDMGAKTIQESMVSDLNPALLRATAIVNSWRAEAVFVLPADLPFISVEDVKQMVALGREPNSIVIATDDQEDGTNALLVRPPGLIEYSYGVGSYRKHLDNAKKVGAQIIPYFSDRIALDIDVPEDLALYHAILAEGSFGHLPIFDTSSSLNGFKPLE